MAPQPPKNCAAFDFGEDEVVTNPQRTDSPVNNLLTHLESVDKILVYAVGAFDRYYMCWQDRQGGYRQERQGLPRALDEWLFPPDGSSRDLESLQVSLGHNDEFFAFDRYERISHINTNLREHVGSNHRRSLTQVAVPTGQTTTIRQKAHTFSHSDDVQEQDQQRPSIQRRQVPKQRLRPRSIAIAGVISLRASHERNKSQEDRSLKAWPGISGGSQRQTATNPSYSDAAVQTDPMQDTHQDDQEASSHDFTTKLRRSHVSSISSLSSLLSDSSSATVDSATSLSSTHSLCPRNPVSMGVMNRYFRESQYRLGDALIRAPSVGIGAR
ncbi:hypothetical protein Z517_04730 [Fonsecaea pedrosoi CBS 271.37]|uniref:Uncharacterized protein n=1 Tax=Fonsecaea pedrosoi CBS 271.37 TaxID=1442368 RepID=A0A0D2HAW0_9EURO|nr:uncharacterized protein Z517_04730 [Fonsecaea pedrosoi CBS 271.37]KIW81704.1 hypothetical protein Z517_04730 [Fonsecaea pedrosoi CBS 271.37]